MMVVKTAVMKKGQKKASTVKKARTMKVRTMKAKKPLKKGEKSATAKPRQKKYVATVATAVASSQKKRKREEDSQVEGEPAKKKAKKLNSITPRSSAPNPDNDWRGVEAYVPNREQWQNWGAWDVKLTNIDEDTNTNKFYIIQLLQARDKSKHAVWTRWGRVGAIGQHNLAIFPTKDLSPNEAMKLFQKKFYQKTKNDWMRYLHEGKFQKVKGKYGIVETAWGQVSREENEGGGADV